MADVNQEIARRVRDLRASHGYSLEALATRCGVSRSMISLIERGEASPTAVVLEKLATGLGLSLAALFDRAAATPPVTEGVARAASQATWRDPASGYVRRNVSPVGVDSPIRVVEVSFPAQARVAYESGTREPALFQQVWVLDGSIDVTVGDHHHALKTGDCLAMPLDRPVMFHNPGRRSCRYAVVIAEVNSSRTRLP